MKRAIRITCIVITIIISTVYLLCSLALYFSPEDIPLSTFASILYLPALVMYIPLAVAWLFFRKRVGVLLIFLFLLSYKSFFSTVGLNVFGSSWTWKKDSSAVRVMSWNVNYFGNTYLKDDSATGVRQQMLRYIREVSPDVLCLQDLRYNQVVGIIDPFVDNIDDILQAGKFKTYIYPFHYEYDGYNYCDEVGVAIFYKGTFLDSGSVLIGGKNTAERFGYIDILVKSKPVRLFTAHFSSMSLWPSDKDEAGLNYIKEDSSAKRAKTIYSKVKMFGSYHAIESKTVKAIIDASPYPVIFSGDLNSVPSGYVYHHLKKGLNDAFLEKDYGIGGTYNRIFPKLRIDVLLHSKELQVTQYARPAVDLSDHYPLIADFKWKE